MQRFHIKTPISMLFFENWIWRHWAQDPERWWWTVAVSCPLDENTHVSLREVSLQHEEQDVLTCVDITMMDHWLKGTVLQLAMVLLLCLTTPVIILICLPKMKRFFEITKIPSFYTRPHYCTPNSTKRKPNLIIVSVDVPDPPSAQRGEWLGLRNVRFWGNASVRPICWARL